MPKRRDLVVLSAILTAPLAATLIAQTVCERGDSSSAELAVEVAPHPAPVVIPEPPAPPPAAEPAPIPAPAPAPEPAPAGEPTRDPSQFMLMHDDALVLHTHAELAWSSGKIGTRAGPGEFIAWRPAVADELPAPARALADATVTVYDVDGSACVATVGALRVQIERTGDVFEVPEDAHDADLRSPYEPPTDRAVLRAMGRDAFTGAGEDALLLARQRNHAGRPCTGLWARRSDLPAPAVFGRHDLAEDEEAELEADALALVRTLPEFARVRDAYAERVAEVDPEYGAEVPSWDTFVDGNFRVVRWDEVGGPRRLVSVELRETPESCGDWFDEGLALIFEQQGDRLVVRQTGWYDLAALTDLERDGTFEGLVTGDFGVRRLEATGPNAAAVRDEFSIPFWGCPC
jgi:hypothetical protein